MMRIWKRTAGLVGLLSAAIGLAGPALASDHLDTRTVIADPRADIGDLYAWMSPDGRRLNLAMTMVGHSFSSELVYAFHVDSGPRFGETGSTVRVECRFDAAGLASCRLGDRDHLHGVAGGPEGIQGRNGEFRVFAGLRDDPFFNNVRGSRDAYQVAAGALARGASVDGANCAAFDRATSDSILGKWRQTEGGPGANFLAGWTPASLIVSVELDEVDRGGPMLAIWATTSNRQRQVDRMGRPLTGNALLAPLAADEVSDTLKDIYNIAAPEEWARFVPDIARTLGLYDSFDGLCGNQLLADGSAPPARRYFPLASILADDRLWVNSASGSCAQFFAVELASLAGRTALAGDCGGRTPTQDAVDVYRSLLAMGRVNGVDDGVDRDEADHSSASFPFLAPVQAGARRD